MARFKDAVTTRIRELQDQQALIQARAATEIAAIQTRLDTLGEIRDAILKDPTLEDLYIKASTLDLGLPRE